MYEYMVKHVNTALETSGEIIKTRTMVVRGEQWIYLKGLAIVGSPSVL